MSGNLVVYAAPLPFSNKQVKRVLVAGSNLRDAANLFLPEGESYAAIIQVDGRPILEGEWERVYPHIGQNVVVNIVPQGGGGGKKNPIASILSIALMVAAPYMVAGLGYASLGMSAAKLTLAGRLVAGGIGIVGGMLINAIAPPPKPTNANGRTENPSESPTMFIEGARNALDPYGVVPICLGTNRMFPKQAARGYTESMNNDQYVRQLFTYGFGKLLVGTFQIGETAISQFDDIQLEHRLEGDLNEGVELFPNDAYQDDYSVLLQQVDGYTTRTTQPNADEAIVDVTFPQGLSSFNTEGTRLSYEVQLEIQYALSGVSPQVWSSPAGTYNDVAGATFTPLPVTEDIRYNQGFYSSTFRKDIIVVDILSGVLRYVQGTGVGSSAASTVAPTTPANSIRIATVTVNSDRLYINGVTTTTFTITDDRQPSSVGVNFETATDFEPNIVGDDIVVDAGALSADPLRIRASQTEALRKSTYIKFPQRGQYDIRIRRVSADTASDRIYDKVSLSSIRTFTYRNPVNTANISGTAIRMRATEQLNGAVDEFNVIASLILPDYDAGTDTWVERVSSNPASLYRYVLQGPANAKPLPDAKIDLEQLEAWHALCAEKGYTYNRIIDYETSVDAILRDIAAAGAASPDIIDGKRTVVIDCEKPDIAQVITPRNSWGYSGQMVYPDMPHAFRVQFRNAAKGYAMDERKVYDDGYSESGEIPGTVAATKFEVLELLSCTSADLAFKHGRRHIASARLRPETHSFMLDVENLVAVRGNRIKFAHDAPIIGIGDGRIKSVTLDGSSPQMITGFTIDDTVTIPDTSEYYVRIRLSDGGTLYKQISNAPGDHSDFTFATPFLAADAPEAGDLCYFVEVGGELDLVITKIEPQDELTARITAVDYAPAVFTAESTTIPAFDSKITTPLSLIRPAAPVLLETPQSDETVMLRNSDGSFTSRMIITLQNDNVGDVEPVISVRVSGTDVFTNANLLEASATRVVITGLQDGVAYDVYIRYHRRGSNQLSLPLQINSYTFVGASTVPSDVSGFVVSIAEGTANFKWEPNDDIDVSHYKIKFAKVFSGASWATAQTLEDLIVGTRLTTTFQGGTYLIKAVDILGNESANATSIITYEEGAIRNVVQFLEEDPDFLGVMDNVIIEDGGIVLADSTMDGYYYFEDTVDLTEVFTSYMSAAVVANARFTNNLFDEEDLFEMDDMFGQLGGDLFEVEDLFAMDDMFGIGEGAWFIQLQYRTTNQDPNSSPAGWGDWEEFTAGNKQFRAVQFRLLLRSLQPNVTPLVSVLSVTIDMPDRVEADNDLVVPVTGLRVDFAPAFKALDGLSIVAQDLATGDYYEVTAKDETGFFIQFFNSVGGGVERTFDYVAAGYGRVEA